MAFVNSMTVAKRKLHKVQEKTCARLHNVQSVGMTITTPLKSDFYATDTALSALKDAKDIRRISFGVATTTLRKSLRLGMRLHAKEAVAAARKYREGRS